MSLISLSPGTCFSLSLMRNRFMFIMGSSLRLSITSKYNKYKNHIYGFFAVLFKVYRQFLSFQSQIILRTAILVLLNWFFNGFTNWDTLRLFGGILIYLLFYSSSSYVLQYFLLHQCFEHSHCSCFFDEISCSSKVQVFYPVNSIDLLESCLRASFLFAA